MPKIKHTSTSPDGSSVAKRTSNRTYSHAVWIREPEARWRQRLERVVEHYGHWARAHTAEIEGRLDDPNLLSYCKHARSLPGAMVAKYGAEIVTKWRDSYQREADAARAEIAAGYVAKPWKCEHWCSRLDLANKAASGWRSEGWEAEITVTVR